MDTDNVSPASPMRESKMQTEESTVEDIDKSMSVPAIWVTGSVFTYSPSSIRIAFTERSSQSELYVRTAVAMRHEMALHFARMLIIGLHDLENYGDELDTFISELVSKAHSDDKEHGETDG